MNALATLFSGPLAQAIGWALLHLMWQGVLVAAILAATLALLQRQSANARYLAACGALVIIVALSFVTAIRAYDPIRSSDDGAPMVFVQSAVATEEAATPAPTETGAGTLLATATSYAASHLPQIVLMWLIGVTLLSTRLIFGWIGAQRMAARYARAAEPRWEAAMQRIAGVLQLQRAIRLLESAAVEVPTVIGWLRPVVLLPVATLSGLSAEQIEMILAHELAHIRRHDFIVNLLQSTVETLFFYQPAVWWISRRIRVEREHCCDDLAVAVCGDPIRYARALTRFEELRIDSAQTVLAANGGSLIARIRRLVAAHGESASWSSRWAAGVALLAVVAALLVAPALPLFAEREKSQPAPAAEPKVTTTDSQIEVDAKSEPSEEAQSEDVQSDDSSDDNNSDDSEDTTVAEAVAEAHRTVVQVPMIAARVAAAVAPMGVDLNRKIADEGKLTVDDLIALRTSGVTPRYIQDMRSIGLGALSLNDLMAMRVQGVSADYVRGLRDAGINVNSAATAIELRIQGVTGDYIKGMRAAGYDKLSARELIDMRVQGVSPRYVQQMADAGYKNLSAHDLVELRVQGVSGDFVKSLAEAGYTNLTVRDLVRLAASGVNSEFIRDLAKYRSKQ